MKTKSNLIIGSNSFLGRILSEKLVVKGDLVLGVFNKNTTNLYHKIHHVPITKLEELKDTYDTVYIVSAFVPNSKSINIEDKLYEVNVKLVETICNKFKKAKIVYCSSVSVYKESNDVIKEKSKLEPSSKYGESKLKGEIRVKKHDKYSIVRIASMYGLNMKVETFLPLVIKNAIQKNEIVLYGDGERQQNYIHVSDVANYLIASANYHENGVFLATNSTSISNKKVSELIKSIMKNTRIIFKGLDNSKSYLYDNAFTNKTLNLTAEKKIQQEVKVLIEWMKKEL